MASTTKKRHQDATNLVAPRDVATAIEHLGADRMPECRKRGLAQPPTSGNTPATDADRVVDALASTLAPW